MVGVLEGRRKALPRPADTGRPLDEFAFGVITSPTKYGAVPASGLLPLSKEMRFEVFALALLQLPGVLHLYFDSFIWKVRDRKIQGGL